MADLAPGRQNGNQRVEAMEEIPVQSECAEHRDDGGGDTTHGNSVAVGPERVMTAGERRH
jgi:hypothetical protein